MTATQVGITVKTEATASTSSALDAKALQYLGGRGIDAVTAAAVGLRSEGGRVVFPWYDADGREIYYCARILNGGPKYVNAPGPRPALYSPSSDAWLSSSVALVEGIIDAVVVQSLGLPVFATAGSSLSEEAVTILARKSTVTVAPDQDQTGKRLLEEIKSRLAGRTRLSVATWPQPSKDPAEYRVLAGEEELAAVFVEAKPVVTSPGRLVPGGSFGLDLPPEGHALWGRGGSVAWPDGEFTELVGPDGSNKTTLALNLSLHLVGARTGNLLGYPVREAPGKVLYVAADRPRQIQRAFRRMISEDDRELLNERLIFWKGPFPFDPLAEPEALTRWAIQEAGERATLQLDSLGALFPDLSKEETGSRIALAFGHAVAEGLNVFGLHHGRKATSDNRKPTGIADVYGSRWLTACAGSVLSLWGAPGDPVVELSHLKPAIDPIGPFLVQIDFDTGAVRVAEGTDALAILRDAPGGMSSPELADRLYAKASTEASRRANNEKSRRALDRLVASGLAFLKPGSRGGAAPDPGRYFPTPPWGRQQQIGGSE